MSEINDTPETITIQLTKGYSTVVDAIDADLDNLNWFAQEHVSGNVYAGRWFKKTTRLYMHRVILERVLSVTLARKDEVDHIDGNGLNNRRDNLRLATKSQNLGNQRLQKNNTSGYKGVSRFRNKWAANIGCDGKTVWLGAFSTPEEAHEAYCKAAKEQYGEFARFK